LSAPIVRLGIRVRADRAELAFAELLPLLAGGAEERSVGGDVEFSVYAPAGELPGADAIRALAGDAVLDVVTEPVPDGWERRWHEFLRPVRVGSLVVRPPWIAGGRGDLVIDPGLCFGAGTHPTTRLCLALLQELEADGALCDWGAGTGVLAVAAARLGWAPVTAVEVDPAATPVIERNAALNGVSVRAVRGDVARAAPWAPVVVANLTRPLLLDLALERRPDVLIASGMLAREADEVVRGLGMRERRRAVEGDWAAVVLA
jgi:ribosomal protein L11 methyltransferase